MTLLKAKNSKIIYIIIVIYYPDENNLLQLLNTIKSDFTNIILIDNTPIKSSFKFKKIIEELDIIFMPLYKNFGIASAQNIGIKYVLNCSNAEYILFLDQDTQLPNNFVYNILKEYNRALQSNLLISVLSPVLISKKNNTKYKINKLNFCNHFIKTDKVSSSGSLISIKTFNIVGLFDESLFIDYVDSEWCWRAKTFNLYCYVTDNIQVFHSIGNDLINFFGIKFIVSNPVRYYYQYRNWLILLNRTYVPMKWKINTTLKNIIFIFIIPFIQNQFFKSYKYIFLGFKDAIKIKFSEK